MTNPPFKDDVQSGTAIDVLTDEQVPQALRGYATASVELSQAHIAALQSGLTLHFSCEEYTVFVRLQRGQA